MANFPVYTLDSAPEGSKPGLQALAQAFGMVPNIAGAIAGSPKLINGLVSVFDFGTSPICFRNVPGREGERMLGWSQRSKPSDQQTNPWPGDLSEMGNVPL